MRCNLSVGVTRRGGNRKSGFTLAEVVVSIAVTGLAFGGILASYIQTARQAEWSGYSLAAQAFAVQQLEQARSAVWDTSLKKNELLDLDLINRQYDASTKTATGYSQGVLDLPYSGNNVIRATNYVTVRRFFANGAANPPVELQMVQVDTVWPFETGHGTRYFTNTAATYFAPDNRDPSSI